MSHTRHIASISLGEYGATEAAARLLAQIADTRYARAHGIDDA